MAIYAHNCFNAIFQARLDAFKLQKGTHFSSSVKLWLMIFELNLKQQI